MKKIIISVVLIGLLYLFGGCSVGNTIQIKNLKDEMKQMQCKVDSLDMKIRELQVRK
jgi:outer membrane murein-binding lipoprotein Lpp